MTLDMLVLVVGAVSQAVKPRFPTVCASFSGEDVSEAQTLGAGVRHAGSAAISHSYHTAACFFPQAWYEHTRRVFFRRYTWAPTIGY